MSFLGAIWPWSGRSGEPRQHYVPVLGPHGFYKLAYVEWGDPRNPRVLVCVHGLTRNARDFDYVARVLARDYRVVSVDMPGRGESDWWDYKTDYSNLNYVPACAALIARLGVDRVDWLGTSMGGIIGMLVASTPNSPIARLIVNDVGPMVPKAALEHIATYVGADPRFESIEGAEKLFRQIAAPFGIKKDEDWRFLTRISVRPAEGGKLRMHYDPGIAIPFKAAPITDWAFWQVWDAIKAPTLVLRGTESILLLPETAAEMTKRGPKTELALIPGCGHAPSLMEPDQIKIIVDWLARTPR